MEPAGSQVESYMQRKTMKKSKDRIKAPILMDDDEFNSMLTLFYHNKAKNK